MASEQERLNEDIENRLGDAEVEVDRFQADVYVALGGAAVAGFGVYETFADNFFVGVVITAAAGGVSYLKTRSVMNGFNNYGRIREKIGNLKGQLSSVENTDKK